MSDSLISRQAHALLRKFYGYDSFRPGQLEIIEAVASGCDAVVLMPTGGGKSMCYQMPALLAEGCAVVVSPLIALMDDQVAALRANGIPAAALHSNLSDSESRTILAKLDIVLLIKHLMDAHLTIRFEPFQLLKYRHKNLRYRKMGCQS